jgi:hypothetical protein
MATPPNRDLAFSWLKNSAGADGTNCVEAACWESSVLVRDSRDQSGTVLEFSPVQWREFVHRIKDGEAALG